MAAIDLGASNGRLLVGTLRRGRLDLSVCARFEHRARRRGGYWRWDWAAIRSAVRLGLRRAAVAAPGRLESVSCSAWAQDFGLLDARGRLLADPVSYRDPRTEPYLAALQARISPERLVRRVGSTAQGMVTLVQLLATAGRQPGLLGRARTLLFVADLVHFDLCGVAATDPTLSSASQLAALKSGTWDGPLLESLGVPARILPPIRPAPAVLGAIGRGAPDRLLRDTPVCMTAGHDTAAALSLAPPDEGAAFLSSGTWSMIGCRQAEPRIPAGLIRSRWALLGLGGEWGLLKGLAGLWLIQECRRAWRRAGREWSYEDIAGLARAHGTAQSLIDPEWPGFRAPPDMPAAVRRACRLTGQPVPDTPGGVAAVIFASLALDYRWALESLARAARRSFASVWLIGGGSRNGLLNQLAADALGIPVVVGPSEATALGNLVLQARALGLIRTAEEGRRAALAPGAFRRHQPRRGWADRLYPRFLELKRTPLS